MKTLKQIKINANLISPSGELKYLNEDDLIIAKYCNKIIYQSAEAYGLIDSKNYSNKQEMLIRQIYFNKFDKLILRDDKIRTKVFNELNRRFDIFLNRLEEKYFSKQGQIALKNLIKTILKNKKTFYILLDDEQKSEVQVFDTLISLSRTLIYFDDYYQSNQIPMPKLRDNLNKYLCHDIVNYFIQKTNSIIFNSRKDVSQQEFLNLKLSAQK